MEEKDLLEELGQRLRKARILRRERQTTFAARLGISRATYIKMEQGNPNIRIGHWVRAAWIMGLLDTWDQTMEVEEDLFEKHDRIMANLKKIEHGRVRLTKEEIIPPRKQGGAVSKRPINFFDELTPAGKRAWNRLKKQFR